MDHEESYRMSLRALSPVHVGSGEVFSQLDYVPAEGKVYLLDFDRLLEAAPVGILDDLTEDITAHFDDNLWRGEVKEFFGRYDLDWREFVENEKELIGDIGRQEIRRFQASSGGPYIPGSSLKGAMRTAVLYRVLTEDRSLREAMAENVERFGNDQRIQGLVGRSSFRDLFRCLQVGDSKPVETKFASGAVYHLEKEELETHLAYEVADRVRTRFPLRIEEKLMGTSQIKTTHFSLSPENLRRACNDFAAAIVNYEREQLGRVNDPAVDKVGEFYGTLRDELDDLGPGEFLLRVGQGSGKVSTSLFLALKEEEGLMEKFTGGQGGSMEVFTFDKENDKRPGQGFTFTEKGKGVAVDREADQPVKPGERWLCRVVNEIDTMVFVDPIRKVQEDEKVEPEKASSFYPKTRKLITEAGVGKYPLGWIKLKFGGGEDGKDRGFG